jgi:transposase
VGGHRPPKLEAHHAGPIAKFLVENRRAKVQDILDFINREFEISLDRKTLRTYVANYGLGCLRGDIIEDAPLF